MRAQYFLKRLLAHRRRGATAIKFAVIVGLIGLATTAATVGLGKELSFITNKIARTVDGPPPVPSSMP